MFPENAHIVLFLMFHCPELKMPEFYSSRKHYLHLTFDLLAEIFVIYSAWLLWEFYSLQFLAQWKVQPQTLHLEGLLSEITLGRSTSRPWRVKSPSNRMTKASVCYYSPWISTAFCQSTDEAICLTNNGQHTFHLVHRIWFSFQNFPFGTEWYIYACFNLNFSKLYYQ